MAGTGDEDEESLYTLNEGEESEDESSYISGESGETLTIVQTGEVTDHLEAIQEQCTPTVDDGAIDDASVAKEVETEDEEIEEEATEEEEDDETSEDDLYNREYITPIEDPYQKALKYFAKHNILELFGVNIVPFGVWLPSSMVHETPNLRLRLSDVFKAASTNRFFARFVSDSFRIKQTSIDYVWFDMCKS